MAHIANTNQLGSGVLNTVSDFFAALWNSAREQAKMEQRLRQMRKLESLSDDELAKLGIARDRIAHHVFRDIYYV